MVQKLRQPDDIIVEANSRYNEAHKHFHEVAESTYMDSTYIKGAVISGIRERLKSFPEDIDVCDIPGGSGRQGHIIRSYVKEDASRVHIYNVDMSREELGKDKKDIRIRGDVMHVPLEDGSMDVVFMNNIPIPLSELRRHAIQMKEYSGGKETMVEMLNVAVDAQYKLALLEGARVLKDNGVMVVSAKYTGQTAQGIQKVVEDLPLKVEKFEIVDLENGVIPLWRKYGKDIERPNFTVTSFRKTGDTQEAEDVYRQLLYTSLEQLMRIQGKNEEKSMIEEVFEEMEKPEKKTQSKPLDK